MPERQSERPPRRVRALGGYIIVAELEAASEVWTPDFSGRLARGIIESAGALADEYGVGMEELDVGAEVLYLTAEAIELKVDDVKHYAVRPEGLVALIEPEARYVPFRSFDE